MESALLFCEKALLREFMENALIGERPLMDEFESGEHVFELATGE